MQDHNSVMVNWNWFMIDCDGCGAEWRNDELEFVKSDIGPGKFLCKCCGHVVALDEE